MGSTLGVSFWGKGGYLGTLQNGTHGVLFERRVSRFAKYQKRAFEEEFYFDFRVNQEMFKTLYTYGFQNVSKHICLEHVKKQKFFF